MVRFTVLASGSKGNSTVVSGGRTRILVDCGLSCRELFRRMRLAGEEPETLDAILITHEHRDHVGGIAVTARKLGIPVYFTESTHRAWANWLTPRPQMSYAQWIEQRRQQAAAQAADNPAEDAEAEAVEAETAAVEPVPTDQPPSRHEAPAWLPAVEHFVAGNSFEIGDITVNPFTIPHDAADPVGFVFRAEGVRLGYATDLGYLPPNVKAQLTGLDLLLLESNHDLEMLRDGPYPWSVKQRVLSRVGHLSNESAAAFLQHEYDGHAACLILAHLSESNNLPELARVATEAALRDRASLFPRSLLIASQQEPLPPVQF